MKSSRSVYRPHSGKALVLSHVEASLGRAGWSCISIQKCVAGIRGAFCFFFTAELAYVETHRVFETDEEQRDVSVFILWLAYISPSSTPFVNQGATGQQTCGQRTSS